MYYDSREKLVQWKLDETLYSLISKVDKSFRQICVICIGTDRSTGDSFGPLTGHMLSRLTAFHFNLYGTFEAPVHALTLPETLDRINSKDSLVIAVDASVGNGEQVGYIGMGYEPVRPGSGLGKELPPVGDISITGIVAMGGLAPFIMLQNASLGMVYHMAEKTFLAIQYSLYKLHQREIAPAENDRDLIRKPSA